jgi:hypothetical protein
LIQIHKVTTNDAKITYLWSFKCQGDQININFPGLFFYQDVPVNNAGTFPSNQPAYKAKPTSSVTKYHPMDSQTGRGDKAARILNLGSR